MCIYIYIYNTNSNNDNTNNNTNNKEVVRFTSLSRRTRAGRYRGTIVVVLARALMGRTKRSAQGSPSLNKIKENHLVRRNMQ